MWYAITAALLAVVIGVHLYWRRRAAQLQQTIEKHKLSLADLQARHDQKASQVEAEQHALFNSMAEGVLVLDADERIQLINQSLRDLFQLTGEVRGQTIMEAFRLQELAKLIDQLKNERVVHGFELELPGVQERWLGINAAAVLDRGGIQRGAIVVFHDLTRIKQLENTRQDFVANVSHELRTPLSLIKGFVETLLDGAKDDPKKCGSFLQTIEKHTDRLTFLIEDLLTISRLESGQIVLNLTRIELRGEVQRVIDDLQSRADVKTTAIENDVPAELRAQADADRLQQVLFNLIENALKYGRAGGKVTVGGKQCDDERVELWVHDDGPGIASDARERVFERFYRVDRARSRDTGGTGLGLAIVKHIVQQHGGEVWVKSELGAGTTFYFTLRQ